MFVKLWMHENVVTILPDGTIAEAEELMTLHRIRRLPVVDSDHHLVGILSKEDLHNALPSVIDANFDANSRALAHQAKVASFMTVNPITTAPTEPLEKVAATMRKHKIGGIPVVVGAQLVGIITESDIFQAFIEILGGTSEGVRLEMAIGNKPESIYRTLEQFKKHEMLLSTLTVCNDFSSDSRLLTIRFNGEEVDDLIDDLWSVGCKINSIIRD